MEAHRKYIDIQFTAAGKDVIGWKNKAACASPAGGYDSPQDVEFFKDKPEQWITVEGKLFAVFFPEDAHAPVCGEGAMRKIVVKVLASGR